MAKKLFADGITGTVAIYEGSDDVLTNPLSRLEDVYFHSALEYMTVRSEVYWQNFSIPLRDGPAFGEQITTIHEHGFGHVPIVLAVAHRTTVDFPPVYIPLVGEALVQAEGTSNFRSLLVGVDSQNVYIRERWVIQDQGDGFLWFRAQSFSIFLLLCSEDNTSDNVPEDPSIPDPTPGKTFFLGRAPAEQWGTITPLTFYASKGKFDSRNPYLRRLDSWHFAGGAGDARGSGTGYVPTSKTIDLPTRGIRFQMEDHTVGTGTASAHVSQYQRLYGWTILSAGRFLASNNRIALGNNLDPSTHPVNRQFDTDTKMPAILTIASGNIVIPQRGTGTDRVIASHLIASSLPTSVANDFVLVRCVITGGDGYAWQGVPFDANGSVLVNVFWGPEGGRQRILACRSITFRTEQGSLYIDEEYYNRYNQALQAFTLNYKVYVGAFS